MHADRGVAHGCEAFADEALRINGHERIHMPGARQLHRAQPVHETVLDMPRERVGLQRGDLVDLAHRQREHD
ncbi:hypothetical protein NECAME_18125 [Necator americanus]|uniref:Uncharacterized protein n=1 Tax=Necator americanus TaxID=51031 RepID=W2TDY2_NECAM|nr:hypothetical protein NECAME_18125 [Necator americanus]ETN79401.1 hypothetical protein NECAME_18125 [Necator americanus]